MLAIHPRAQHGAFWLFHVKSTGIYELPPTHFERPLPGVGSGNPKYVVYRRYIEFKPTDRTINRSKRIMAKNLAHLNLLN